MWLRKVRIPLSPAGLLTDDSEASLHAALPASPSPQFGNFLITDRLGYLLTPSFHVQQTQHAPEYSAYSTARHHTPSPNHLGVRRILCAPRASPP